MRTTKNILIIIVVLAIAVTVFGMAKRNVIVAPTVPPIACTQEAKLCPDGSYVGRTGPNCEFAECPQSPQVPPVVPPSSGTGSTTAVGYVSGHISIGPFCPVERPDQPCPTPPSAYSSRQVVAYQVDANNISTVLEKGIIDGAGNYKIALPPGTYYIQIQPAGIGPGEKKQVIVSASKTSVTDFNIDTGIR